MCWPATWQIVSQASAHALAQHRLEDDANSENLLKVSVARLQGNLVHASGTAFWVQHFLLCLQHIYHCASKPC